MIKEKYYFVPRLVPQRMGFGSQYVNTAWSVKKRFAEKQVWPGQTESLDLKKQRIRRTAGFVALTGIKTGKEVTLEYPSRESSGLPLNQQQR